MRYNSAMARELLFQTECGASGDMILAALIDLLDAGDEFKKTFENIGLDVTVTVADVEKNHLRCKQVTVAAPAAGHGDDLERDRGLHRRLPFFRRGQGQRARIFQAIFAAEAAVHGDELKDVHLHEVGADDSLVDILGFCWLWEKLDCCPIYFTTLVTGTGSVRTRHGVLPVPPPAVLRLVQGFACRSGDIEDELLTPTGAAILTTFGTPGRRRPGRPAPENRLRLRPQDLRLRRPTCCASSLEERRGTRPPTTASGCWKPTSTTSAPSCWPTPRKRSSQAGALDVFIASGLMKKGRPGFQLTVLCRPGRARKSDRRRLQRKHGHRAAPALWTSG